MNSYEIRRAERIERLRERADKLADKARATQKTAEARAAIIPFGQPILVGHHSEGRDRRYREKIRNGFQKAAEFSSAAADLAGRAHAAETNTAISSDDPDAPDKIRAKLAGLEAQQKLMVAFNRALRAGDWKIVAAGKDASWELYDVSSDRSESKNLADQMPEKVRELAANWTRQLEEFTALAAKDLPPDAKTKDKK